MAAAFHTDGSVWPVAVIREALASSKPHRRSGSDCSCDCLQIRRQVVDQICDRTLKLALRLPQAAAIKSCEFAINAGPAPGAPGLKCNKSRIKLTGDKLRHIRNGVTCTRAKVKDAREIRRKRCNDGGCHIVDMNEVAYIVRIVDFKR